jgi:hypothetical protein
VDKIPGIELMAASRDAVLQAIRQRLQTCALEVEVVSIDVDVPSMGQPPLPGFGSFADDPTFDDWRREMEDYRERQNRASES